MIYCLYQSPVGDLFIAEDSGRLCGLSFICENTPLQGKKGESPLLQETIKQLREYFAGKRKIFTLPLKEQGSEFQNKVWQELLKIPYGETASYGEIARLIGNPKAQRAVGMANHNNPWGIIVPCHRVIAHDGSLGGYAGGLEIKTYLLQLEKANK